MPRLGHCVIHGNRFLWIATICRQFEVDQPVRVIECRTQNLTPRHILEGGGNTTINLHRTGLYR